MYFGDRLAGMPGTIVGDSAEAACGNDLEIA
jgi:hypothetical protein